MASLYGCPRSCTANLTVSAIQLLFESNSKELQQAIGCPSISAGTWDLCLRKLRLWIFGCSSTNAWRVGHDTRWIWSSSGCSPSPELPRGHVTNRAPGAKPVDLPSAASCHDLVQAKENRAPSSTPRPEKNLAERFYSNGRGSSEWCA